jgi:hypothetical protein
MNIHPAAAEMLHADGQTGMTKVIFAFRTSVNAPKYYILSFCRMMHSCVFVKHTAVTFSDIRSTIFSLH